jgi:hypothetical protein
VREKFKVIEQEYDETAGRVHRCDEVPQRIKTLARYRRP